MLDLIVKKPLYRGGVLLTKKINSVIKTESYHGKKLNLAASTSGRYDRFSKSKT